MPNWVTVKAKFNGSDEDINKLRKLVISEENDFDFNKIIPMPESLDVVAGSDETIATACAKARRNHMTTCKEYEAYKRPGMNSGNTFDEWADVGDIYISNKEKYGYSTWYDWRIANWGTKWNASDSTWYGDDYVVFDTAWSMPEEIFMKLAKLFPSIDIDVVFADEDIGNNCGTVTCKNGKFSIDYVNDFEFACDVLGYDPSEFEEEENESEMEDYSLAR